MLVLPQQTRVSQPQTQTKIAGWIRPKDLWVPQYGKCKNLARDLDTVAKSTNSKYSPAYYGNGVGNDSNATNGRGFSTGGFTSDSGVWYTGLSEITIFAVATTPGLNGTNFNQLARLDADISSAIAQIGLGVFNNAGSLRMANILSTTTNNGWVVGSYTNVRATTSIDLSQPALYIQRWKSGTIHQAGIESIGKNSVTFVNSPLSPKPSGSINVQGSSTTPMQMHIGGLAYTLGEFEWCGRIYLVGVLPYCISQEDADRLVRNPWQIFQPDRRAIFLPATSVTLSYLRPSADISTGSWTPSSGTTLYETLDEVSASDADYIQTQAPSTCEIQLSAGSAPLAKTNHTLKYSLLAGSGTIIVHLVQGTTIKKTWNHTLTGSTQQISNTLTEAEANTITDYSDLRVRFET